MVKENNKNNVMSVKVGVGIIIFYEGKILLGKRKNSHGVNTWSFPGGHLEPNETPEECAQREAQEECGIKIEDIRRGPWSNDIFIEEEKHYVTLFVLATLKSGHPKVNEPDKCECWLWFNLDQLPQPLFLPIQNLLSIYSLQKLLE